MTLLFDFVTSLINRMRQVGTDLQGCEVKEAVVKLPNSVLETISAFANTSGGVIILGLSEKNGFRPAKGFDAQKIQTAMISVGDCFTPIIRMEVEIFPFEGAKIVVVQVPPIDKHERPCYITAQGPIVGAYVRTGDGDRRLSGYEVARMQEERKQPKYDLEPVLDATIDDLNQDVLKAVVNRNKMITPRIFGKMSSEEILIKLGALVKIKGIVYPTLGALLAAGVYPQQFFPRLNITFTVYSVTTKAKEKYHIFKYIDSKQINGSIPEMLIDARDFLLKNIRSGAVIEGALRRDIYDYPLDAFREAVVNALQHRDYSPEGRSSQVQINLFSDRLEILNPGGIYGPASIDDSVHGISSTRNVNLSRLLECVPYEEEDGNKGYVIENRGTGLIQIRSALNRELMPPPKISDYISSFSIVFSKRRLSENERSHKRAKDLSEAILAEFAKHETLSIAEISSWSGVNRRTVSLHLNRLVEQGKLERTAPLRSPKQRFRLKI